MSISNSPNTLLRFARLISSIMNAYMRPGSALARSQNRKKTPSSLKAAHSIRTVALHEVLVRVRRMKLYSADAILVLRSDERVSELAGEERLSNTWRPLE